MPWPWFPRIWEQKEETEETHLVIYHQSQCIRGKYQSQCIRGVHLVVYHRCVLVVGGVLCVYFPFDQIKRSYLWCCIWPLIAIFKYWCKFSICFIDTLFFNWYDLFSCIRPLILWQLCLLLLWFVEAVIRLRVGSQVYHSLFTLLRMLYNIILFP